ncbi:cysteine proteinase [Trametopsis cervina]|nr:cysteine proteinase [Trametopsis cervina]
MAKGTAKRKSAKLPPQIRSRTTRSKGKAITDPAENTQLLTEQLRALGLYAASTLGDGNCLFRALSDQLYGSDTFHLKLRQEICNWIETHNTRYAPFVDDERGLAVHLQCMRQPATYGGHLELSAFAHMTRRNIKVIQPGLVYVIEWNAGDDKDGEEEEAQPVLLPTRKEDGIDQSKPLTRRELKRLEKEGISALPPFPQRDDGGVDPIYVAYHDWEHFSSIRNLRGPHSGLPNVQESPIPDNDDSDPLPISPIRKKPVSSSRSNNNSNKVRRKTDAKRTRAPTLHSAITATFPLTPSQIPLPMSRSPSPGLDESQDRPPIPYPLPSTPPSPSRIYRSPKRTFDESSASSESSQSLPKRARGSKPPSGTSRLNPDFDIDTPSLTLSTPGSPSSLSELSSLSSRDSTPPVEEPRPAPSMTKRQRKQMGLPKPRTAVVASTRASAGKIVIPGGRYKRAGGYSSKPVSAVGSEASEEWQRNGTGRLDVRGFRELKI